MNNNFRLLAIRPLEGCQPRFLKNLKADNMYKLYNEYLFLDRDGMEMTNVYAPVDSISKNELIPADLYNLTNNIGVNISAIVGKNGSGKSTLLELFYTTCYVLACRADIIKPNREPEDSNPTTRSSFENFLEVSRALNLEVFYCLDGVVHSIKLHQEKLQHSTYLLKKELYRLHESKELKTITEILRFLNLYFPYTIAINYSLYGLNSKFMGEWVEKLFHKNDGYQTPLVVNPYRTDGNINVNNELHLAQTRLFTNIIKDYSNSTINHKEIARVIFEKDDNKYKDKIEGPEYSELLQNFKEKNNYNNLSLIREIDKYFYNKKEFLALPAIKKNSSNFDFQCNYVFRKILKISRYPEYTRAIEIDKTNNIVTSEEFFKFCNLLSSDKTHITLKLRQVLNSLRFNPIEGEWLELNKEDKSKVNHETYNRQDLKKLIRKLSNLQKVHSLPTEELIPIGCYNIILQVKNEGDDNKSNLDNMSSGEQHFIHSLQSILYHILNVNSVFKNTKSTRIKYAQINIILDEIELYYHPEFQRIFISELLKKLEGQDLNNIKSINFLFSTHSPFILSDIPDSNILFLEKGGNQSPSKKRIKTFGGNIHELLAHSFFLEHGLIGEFAKQRLNDIINFLIKDENKIKFDSISILKEIDMVGEPFLRQKLLDMYYMKYDNKKRIQELKAEIAKLERND